jgi:hypothetical protein
MNHPSLQNSAKAVKKSPQLKAIESIWGLAIGMLGICIPLVAITESGIILPLAVILGASGTSAVIGSTDKQQQDQELHNSIKALEERVMNLETIVSQGELEMPQTYQPLKSSDLA